MTTDAFKRSLKDHQDKGFFKNLKILRGIERESLRVSEKGRISQKNHPENLDSQDDFFEIFFLFLKHAKTPFQCRVEF